MKKRSTLNCTPKLAETLLNDSQHCFTEKDENYDKGSCDVEQQATQCSIVEPSYDSESIFSQDLSIDEVTRNSCVPDATESPESISTGSEICDSPSHESVHDDNGVAVLPIGPGKDLAVSTLTYNVSQSCLSDLLKYWNKYHLSNCIPLSAKNSSKDKKKYEN